MKYLPSPRLAIDYSGLPTETCVPCCRSLMSVYLRTRAATLIKKRTVSWAGWSTLASLKI